MEDEIRAFLIRVLQTISMTLLWMLTHSLVGITWGYLFWGDHQPLHHIIYYVLLAASGAWVLYYLLRKWKQAPKYDRPTDQWIYPAKKTKK
jgi:hypothetical protein